MFFFFNDTATTEIYTLSLHDALPISARRGADDGGLLGVAHHRRGLDPLPGHGPQQVRPHVSGRLVPVGRVLAHRLEDRKSTRLNSSHANISYAVFCLKKKTSAAHRLRKHNTTHHRTSAS